MNRLDKATFEVVTEHAHLSLFPAKLLPNTFRINFNAGLVLLMSVETEVEAWKQVLQDAIVVASLN